MSAQYHIDWRDGWLCVVYSEPLWLEPTMGRHWWPVRECRREDVAYLIGLKATGRDGVYGVRLENIVGGRWEDVYLKDGAQTRPIHSEMTPIVPPRVRKGIAVRWQNGRWEKHLKSEGWVAA